MAVQSTTIKTKITTKLLAFPSSSTSTVSTTRHRSFLSRPDVVGCGWEVAELF
jgi:hypothetical protein